MQAVADAIRRGYISQVGRAGLEILAYAFA
ncbi:hypothetical protein MPLA_1690003 [Mesorhizobium sp. ORS 3359]|nr:hypothetical protein MPLA_1690003 [Mesorhizobium sp. ORS 3359]